MTIILLILLLVQNAQSFVESDEPAKTSDCQIFKSPLCDIDRFLTVAPFSNSLGHQDAETAIAELHKHYYLFQKDFCNKAIKAFLCSLYAPVCVPLPTGYHMPYTLPCREECEEAQRFCEPKMLKANSTWPDEWRCSKFVYRSVDAICFSDDDAVSSNNETNNSPSSHVTNESPSIIDSISQSSDNGPVKFPSSQYCDNNMFDCRLVDSYNQQQKLKCIEDKFVCDGKNDCTTEGNEPSLDEVGCGLRCQRENFWCTGLARCLNETEFCDGKVDCPSGFDEQNCTPIDIDDGKILLVLLILSLSILISFMVKCFGKSGDQTNKSSTTETTDSAPPSLVIQNQTIDPHLYEPAESTASIYHNRCLLGNEYSAASSVYTYPCYPNYHNQQFNHNQSDSHYADYSKPVIHAYKQTNNDVFKRTTSNEELIQSALPAPPAPPPTPAPSYGQQLYMNE